eukprot:Em0015g67a
MTSSPDSRANQGLTNALSNVFKLGEVEGLKWVRYVGPPSVVMEAPKLDPVLSSYAKLLSEGYACAWRCHCPGTDGITEETKDLWLFYFTQDRPDFGDKLGAGLKEEGSGGWEDGMTVDSTTMLYRALNNLIERSLLSENFLPLGKWFARPDSSVSTDGSSRGVFLCSFSFFIHAHLFICASVDLRCGPSLQPLVKTHISQALASSNGLQVILSPSGLNAIMTGHSYRATDPGIQDILEEWKLFYPRRFTIEPPPGLPSAVEVVPTPPPSPTDPSLTKELVECVWESTGCVEPVRQQSESGQCKCRDTSVGKVGLHTHRPKRPGDSSAMKLTHTKRVRHEAPPTTTTTKDAGSTPGSLSLSIPLLHTKRKLSQFGMQPKYTTPLPSPAISSPPHKPPHHQPPPAPPTNSTHSSSQKVYDPSRINGLGTAGTYVGAGRRWWDCLALPEGSQLSAKQPSFPKAPSSGGMGVSGGVASGATLSSLLSPTSKGGHTSLASLSSTPRLYPGAGVTMTTMDTMMGDTTPFPLASATVRLDPGVEKKLTPVDHFSEKAVKISTALDQIFDSDGEEDSQPDSALLLSEKADTNMILSGVSKTAKIAGTDLSLSELSRIYPTPPSVESMEDKYDEGRGFAEERIDHHGMCDVIQHYDEELSYIPQQFAPLSNIHKERLPKHCIYEQPQKSTPSPISANTKSTSLSTSERSSQGKTEPATFIFPPPTTAMSRAQRIEALAFPGFPPKPSYLSIPQGTPHTASSSSSFLSPAFPRPSGRPYRGALSSVATPLESPFDSVTPTPLGPNRLIPVLAEAHGLYINLSLLDSALGANFSEPLQINTGTLMTSLQHFYTQRRMKLDSIESAATVAMDTDPDLFCLKEEKPVMTFGIADFPSLGFREGVGPSPDKAMDASRTPFGALSNLMSMLGVNAKEVEQPGTSFPMNKFLELLQDYSVDLCLHGNTSEATSAVCDEAKRRGKKESQVEGGGGRLYHSHSVVSAITAGKQLLLSAKGKPVAHSQKPLQVTLTKEDNSASWILELLTLPTEFVSKRLKELRSVFQYSFQHAPCLKFSAKGPLTLKDLQQLAPSQTALGDECAPLPMQSVVVGYEHEWVAVSPLSLPIWDKLLFEPCSMKKDILYLVVVPNNPSLLPAVRKYFRDLSIVFRTCHLGQHLAIEKDPIGEGGVVVCPPLGTTDDPLTNSRHGWPAGLTELESVCSKVLEPFLSNLTLDQNAVPTYTKSYDGHPSTNQPGHLSGSQPAPPTSLVIYVVCDGEGGAAKMESFQIFHVLSKLVSSESIKQKTRDLSLIQLVRSREVHGCGASRGGHLRNMALSVYARCRPVLDMMEDIKTLTTFGPASQRMQLGKDVLTTHIYAPPFVLSPEPPLGHNGLPGPGGVTKSQVLFSPDEDVLLCGYCVSPDQCWLLVACCDRQGELLDTAVIGITQMPDAAQSRLIALQHLWNYLLSIVARTLVRWNVVITRLGKPSNAEIRDWPTIIDDGLINANQLLCGTCDHCMHTANRGPCDGSQHPASPHLTNVLVLSVQPERTIQLVQTQQESSLAVSHAVVLPQDPRASTTIPAPGESADDWTIAFSGPADSGDFGGVGVDILDDIEMDHIHLDTQAGITLGADASTPKATGYLISTSPCGGLPLEFWGYQKPYSDCSMFKVLLHCHRSEKEFADSPQETLGSTLVSFDALSWLTVDQITEQRRSCLPIHLFILSKMHHLFGVLDQVTHKP